MDIVQGTTAEDMLEASVLQNEESLDNLAKRLQQTGSPEGARFPVKLNIDGKLVEVKDTPDEDKARIAQAAVKARAEKAEAETKRYAKFKLAQMNDVEAVDFIRSQVEGERDIYLEAEREGQNRKAIFDVFGAPPGKTVKKGSK